MVDNVPPDGVGVAQSSEVALHEFTEFLMERDVKSELKAHMAALDEIERQIDGDDVNTYEMFALMEERHNKIGQLFGAGLFTVMQRRAQEERARFEADFGL